MSSTSRIAALAVAALVVVSGRVAGAGELADYRPPEFLSAPHTLPESYDEANALRLDLADALAIALRQNLGIVTERKRLAISQLSETAASAGMYDPSVSASYSHSAANTPPATAQAGPEGAILTQTTEGTTVGINQRLPTGAQISLGFQVSRTASTSGAAVGPLIYNSALNFMVTQPLLRGFSRDLVIPQMSILTAKISTEQEKHALEIAAAQIVEQTESAYWDVVQMLYAYDVALKSQSIAQDAVVLMQREIAAGMTPPIEITGSRSTYAQRHLAVISAGQAVEQAWDALRTALNLPRDQWSRPILPTEQPRFDPEVVVDAETAYQLALAHRPEVAQQALAQQAADLSVRAAENATLPDISLALTGSVFGQNAALDGALDQLASRDAAGWGATLNVIWTPLNRAAKANAESARIQREIHLADRDQHLQGIWSEVRTAVRNERSAAMALVAAADSRTLASQTLEIETRKYASGGSSNVDLATMQRELVSAQLAELQALLGQEKAAAALLRATGQLLEKRHIDLQVTGRGTVK